jgi:hypothetical protein
MVNRVKCFFAALAFFAAVASVAEAAIPTCDIHKGTRIWFLDYADSDTASAHPLGVASGIVDINEREWHSKCSADGPYTKIYVPFTATSGINKGQFDTRWPQDVYRTKAEAVRAYGS